MEKIDYKHGKFLILTTDTDGFSYGDYLAYCEANGIHPQKENSESYFNWLGEEVQANYESDMDNIKSCAKYKVRCIITGRLGLWNGNPEIRPVVCESIAEAIEKCVSGSDTTDCNVWYNDGKIEVEAYHHDGTNCFTIQPLSAYGEKKVAKSEDKPYLFVDKKCFKRLPYLYAI
jgi:hypothetical protein